MPVLRAECCVFPDLLFDEILQSDSARVWRVLHTKPRQEKAIARELARREVPFFLPLVVKRNRFQGRILKSHLPLFPGYVFLFGTVDEADVASSTYRIANTLEVFDQEQLWHDLAQLRRVLSSNLPVLPEDCFVPGKRVLIRSGPLAGTQGEIVKSASGRRFLVRVNFLQRGASVTIDDVDLELAAQTD
jgi:transcriptional antiterminator RfaH